MKMTDNGQGSANFDSNPSVSVSQYDASIRLYTAAYEPMFTMAYACIRSQVSDDARLLIVGAGTGMEICIFGQRSPGWAMTGVDPSGDVLAIAKRKIDEKRLSNPVTLFKGYMDDLPETRYFDAATCILVLHFFPDDGSKLWLLESIGRRLKSGSPFVLVDGFGVKESATFKRTMAAWKTFVKTRGVDPQRVEDAFRGQLLNRLQYVSEERIEALLDEAGFEKPARFYTGFLYGGWMTKKK
jgi:tRNA (cmo5U34)-methyltransferase